jgi:hypothetical protein
MGAEISDILEIRDLAYQYAQAVDRHDSEAFAGAFLDNGVLCGSGYLSEGREQLLRVPQFTAKRWLKTFHAVHNHRIAVDGDKATGEVYCIAHHFREVEGSGHTDHVMVIRYLDDYVPTSRCGMWALSLGSTLAAKSSWFRWASSTGMPA